jgi:hypothetical protein
MIIIEHFKIDGTAFRLDDAGLEIVLVVVPDKFPLVGIIQSSELVGIFALGIHGRPLPLRGMPTMGYYRGASLSLPRLHHESAPGPDPPQGSGLSPP